MIRADDLARLRRCEEEIELRGSDCDEGVTDDLRWLLALARAGLDAAPTVAPSVVPGFGFDAAGHVVRTTVAPADEWACIRCGCLHIDRRTKWVCQKGGQCEPPAVAPARTVFGDRFEDYADIDCPTCGVGHTEEAAYELRMKLAGMAPTVAPAMPRVAPTEYDRMDTLELLRHARAWMNEAVGDSWRVHDRVNPPLFDAIDTRIAAPAVPPDVAGLIETLEAGASGAEIESWQDLGAEAAAALRTLADQQGKDRVERHEWEKARQDKADALELWRNAKAELAAANADAKLPVRIKITCQTCWHDGAVETTLGEVRDAAIAAAQGK